MARPSSIKPSAGFPKWLYDARQNFKAPDGRELQKKTLSFRSGVGQSTISQLESGERKPSRDMVRRLVVGLVPDGLPAEEASEIHDQLLREAVRAAFDVEDEDEYDEGEDIAYLKGLSDEKRARALKLLKAAFEEEDALDNANNIGKRAQ